MPDATASPCSGRPVALRFSNYFGLKKRQSELDFVDILLDTDIPLYIDPFALSVEDDDWSRECSDLVTSFFQDLVDALYAKKLLRAREILNNLHEPNETRLGQSSGKPQGRGIGYTQANSLYHAFSESKAVETGILTDLSDCELFIDGIGHDKISDITTNIIRRKLVEFTEEQCRKWGIPTESKPYGASWDPSLKDWRCGSGSLPVYNGYPLILVPKRSVRYAMAIDDRDFYDMRVVEFIRQDFNRAECLNPHSALFKLLRTGKRVTKKEVSEFFPKSKDFLRQFSEQFPEILEEYKRSAEQSSRSGKGKPSDGEIYDLAKRTAHSQDRILIEELHVSVNNVGGDNFGSVGDGNHVFIQDVKVLKSGIDASQHLGAETKELLKLAIDAIEDAKVDDKDKQDAKEDLQKLSDELQGEKKPGRISRLITRLGEIVPPAAAILKGGQEIAGILSQIPQAFGS